MTRGAGGGGIARVAGGVMARGVGGGGMARGSSRVDGVPNPSLRSDPLYGGALVSGNALARGSRDRDPVEDLLPGSKLASLPLPLIEPREELSSNSEGEVIRDCGRGLIVDSAVDPVLVGVE